MESLVGYGSDDDNETERYSYQQPTGSSGAPGGSRRRDDDTNYDDVNMDLSEESQESEPELPQAEEPRRRNSDESRSRSREHERRDKRRDSPRRDKRERREERKDDRNRSERERSRGHEGSKRGLLGDRPENKVRETKMPALMDIKTNLGETSHKSQDARDAVSPRFVDRERRDRDRDRERSERDRERDRDRNSRRSPDKRTGSSRHGEERRSRSRGNYTSSAHSSGSSERRGSPPSGDYRPSSYKVNKKLEVMEKMGLQIKTPDGSMATAQQLRAAAAPGLPAYCSARPAAAGLAATRVMEQVQKRKLLWSSKKASESEEAAKWSGATFSQDSDGRQANKFMRLMGIKDAAALKAESTDKVADPIKKQEELFQAMQAQYEVARATTHTMRGVGLGFQRSQF